MSTYLYVHQMGSGPHGCQKKDVDALELELEEFVSHHVVLGGPNPVGCKSKQFS